MALIRYGGGIVQMSGSIAGNTYARNRYGNYTRARTKPVNPRSTTQVYARSIVTYLTEYWNDVLTAQQRTDWATYADNVAMKNKLGETIKLSGFNHFIRSNTPKKWFGRPLCAAAPVIFDLAHKDPTVVIDVDSSPQNIAVTLDNTMDWASETWAMMYMRQGQPQNGSRNFFAGPWKMCLLIPGSPAPPGSPTNVIPIMPVATGQKCWCAFRISREDGRLSEMWHVHATVHGQAIGEVPMLIGMLQVAAEALLTSPEVQLTVGVITTANHPTIPVDHVISTDPVAHTRLNAGDPVNLLVSLGPTA